MCVRYFWREYCCLSSVPLKWAKIPEKKSMAAITMVLSQDVGSFPIIHEKKNLGNHSRGIR